MEVKAKTYYGLKTMARKFRQVENIAIYLQNMPTYYVMYRKEERIKALIKLNHKEGMGRVVPTEESNVNVSKRVTMEHCFEEKGKQETTK